MAEGCKVYGVKEPVQDTYNKWSGSFVAAATSLCLMGILADIVESHSSKRHSVACRRFPLNALTIAILGYVTHITSVFDQPMPGLLDQLAKLFGVVLLCCSMNHAMPSLGVMNGKALFSNMSALLLIIVPLSYKIFWQIREKVVDYYASSLQFYTTVMLIIYVVLVSHALTVTSSRKLLESRYNARHEDILAQQGATQLLSTAALEKQVQRYWLMALTSGPDYALRTSGLSVIVALLCVFIWSYWLVETIFAMRTFRQECRWTSASPFKQPIIAVLAFQSTAILASILTIYPRLWTAKGHGFGKWRRLFVVEDIRLELLREWERVPLDLGSRVVSAMAYHLKSVLVKILILLQCLVTFISKLFFVINWLLDLIILSPIIAIYVLFHASAHKDEAQEEVAIATADEDGDHLKEFVLHLDGEEDDKKAVARKWKDYPRKKWIDGGRKRPAEELQSLILITARPASGEPARLLRQLFLDCFRQLDTRAEYFVALLRNCWSLHVMTITCVIYAGFRSVADAESLLGNLQRGVAQGFEYLKLVDKFLKEPAPKRTRQAAKMVWEGFKYRRYWVDHSLSCFAGNFQDVLGKLHSISSEMVETYKNGAVAYEEWPLDVVAAESMVYVTNAMVEFFSREEYRSSTTCEARQLVEALVVVLRSCLADNLPSAILRKCSDGSYGSREANVQAAARVLGETEIIMNTLLESPPRGHFI